jgi:hypothetical protein
MQTINVKHISREHADWSASLGFYKDELAVFTRRLTEVAEKNTAIEITKNVEHFQNQFLLQAENIDILQHDINIHVSKLAREAQSHAGHINQEEQITHDKLKERFGAQESIFIALKEEFMKFLSKVM